MQSTGKRYEQDEINEVKSIEVYPNPLDNELNITLNGQDFATFNIYNTFGSKMISGRLVAHENNKVNTTQLTPGIYYLELLSDKGDKQIIKLAVN